MCQNDLIFDIGMHSGVDTDFYLAKGFRVVGVEANPLLVADVKKRLSTAFDKKRLFIENVGIFNLETVLKFYLNKDVDEWSSFDEYLGTRENTKFTTMDIACRRIDYFIGKYGMPYYMKIDVEGIDPLIVRDLSRWDVRPTFISIEDSGIEALIALYESGVRKFKFINQLAIRDYKLPTPAIEGRTIEHKFGVSSSGPFGHELPGEWLTADMAFKYYCESVRPPGQPPINGWWDIQGWYETS